MGKESKPSKAWTEWVIFKMTRPPDYWAGPYRSEARARHVWETDYASDPVFAIAKVTTEFLPAPRRGKAK